MCTCFRSATALLPSIVASTFHPTPPRPAPRSCSRLMLRSTGSGPQPQPPCPTALDWLPAPRNEGAIRPISRASRLQSLQCCSLHFTRLSKSQLESSKTKCCLSLAALTRRAALTCSARSQRLQGLQSRRSGAGWVGAKRSSLRLQPRWRLHLELCIL